MEDKAIIDEETISQGIRSAVGGFYTACLIRSKDERKAKSQVLELLKKIGEEYENESRDEQESARQINELPKKLSESERI